MDLNALNSISYGLYAVGVKSPDGRPSASVVNALIQVTAQPPCVCVCINHDNYTNECIRNNGLFTVSAFSEDAGFTQIASLGFKSGRETDKLAGHNYRLDDDGFPFLNENICAWFKCRVVSESETSTHTLFIAEVIDAGADSASKPMTYEYYKTILKGKASKNATHI